MKVGVAYPQTETGGDPEALEQIGLAVEALGYDSMLMYDHVVCPVHEGRDPPLLGSCSETNSFHCPFMAFSFLAGITKKIEFVTGALILPQRQTALVAKQATDLDLISRQRLTLGVGTGWNYVEYQALGQDFHTRGKRMDEQIPYLRRLWAEPLVSFDGRFDSIDRANITPRPKRQIPIFCGGFGEAPYRRAARMADGFIFAGDLKKSVLPGWKRIQELLAEADRPVGGFGAHLLMQDSPECSYDVDSTLDLLQAWRDAGGTHASVGTMYRGYTTPQQHIDFLAEIKQSLDA